jgi:RNA polymerase sigma-70 factor (ECF subfamily)
MAEALSTAGHGADAPHEPLAGTPSYEAALLECAAGRTSAVATLYIREGSRLRQLARRIVRDRDRAEDVIHDAFAQILRDAKSFDPTLGSARAWVYAIVRNTALKSLHSAGREVAVADDALATICEQQQQAAQGPQPAQLAESADLHILLEALDPRRRASLILAFVDGRTHREIAEVLGVPVGTVKAWIRRELIALRKRLK